MRESQGLGFADGKMVSRVSSGFRHLRREPDVMLTKCAGCLFPQFASTKHV